MGNTEMMRISILGEENFKDSVWSGGTTRQLAIEPEQAEYADRQFLFRLSTAASDQEESSFTALPDYDRILMVLEGDVVLVHGGRRSAHLTALEQDAFGGEEDTKCFGRLCRDYNLIFRKGSKGTMQKLALTEEAAFLRDLPGIKAVSASGIRYTGLFCLNGYLVIHSGTESHIVRQGRQAVITAENDADRDITVMGEGVCILMQVIPPAAVKDAEPALEKEAEPALEKVSARAEESAHQEGRGPAEESAPESGDRSAFADYRTCLRLYFSSNRWSQAMRREGKSTEYHDPQLAEALQRLEKRYITSIVWIAGVLLCFLPVLKGPNLQLSVILAAVFTLVHLFLIAPRIYLKVLPRPLCDHMKDTSALDESEQRYHQEEIREDPRMEKLMRRYRSDEDNYFTDETSPLRHLMKK